MVSDVQHQNYYTSLSSIRHAEDERNATIHLNENLRLLSPSSPVNANDQKTPNTALEFPALTMHRTLKAPFNQKSGQASLLTLPPLPSPRHSFLYCPLWAYRH
jgi:hypothetical protein